MDTSTKENELTNPQDYHIAVPTNELDEAVRIAVEDFDGKHSAVSAREIRSLRRWQAESQRLHRNGYTADVYIVPARVHSCEALFTTPGGILPEPGGGLFMPSLNIFTQSLLDCGDNASLECLMDGKNLPDEWRKEVGIQLEEFEDVFISGGFKRDRLYAWQWLIDRKQCRLSGKRDPKYFVTCYRLHRDCDFKKRIKCSGAD